MYRPGFCTHQAVGCWHHRVLPEPVPFVAAPVYLLDFGAKRQSWIVPLD